jgi:hypothetical protein
MSYMIAPDVVPVVGCVEVNTLKQRVNFDRGLSSGGECMLATLTCSAQMTKGTKIDI